MNTVQSMLKNNTELADSRFPPRGARLPRWHSQNTIASRENSASTSVSHYTAHAPRPYPRYHSQSSLQRSLRGPIRRDHEPSARVTAQEYAQQLRHQPRSRRPALGHGPATNESGHDLSKYRSRSTIGSLATGHVLSPVPAHSDRMHSRPRQPMGRHAPNPAGESFHKPFRRSHSAITAASLPSTSSNRRRSRNAFCKSPDYGPLRDGQNGRPRPGHGLYKSQLRPSPYSTSHLQSVHVSSTTSLDVQSMAASETSLPFYYDYSESFGQLTDSVSSPLSRVLATPAPGTQSHPRNARSPFGLMPGSEFAPVELPTRHNRRASEESPSTSNETQAKATLPPQPMLKHVGTSKPDLQLCLSPISPPQYAKRLSSAAPEESDDTGTRPHEVSITPHRIDTAAHLRSTSPRRSASVTSGTFFTNADRSPRNLTQLAARAHSPVDDAREAHLNLAAAFEDLECHIVTPASPGLSKLAAPFDWKLPSLQFRPLSMNIDPPRLLHAVPSEEPGRRCEDLSLPPDKQPPVPSRECSSNILDVDEIGSLIDCYHSEWPRNNKDGVQSDSDGGSATPFQNAQRRTRFNDKKTPGHSTAMLSHLSGFLDVDPYPSPLTSHGKSTVGSLLDKHILALGLQHGSTVSSVCSEPSRSDRPFDTSDSNTPKPSSTDVSAAENKIEPMKNDCYRPNSLTSSAHARLIPKRLFADQRPDLPLFPFMSDESEILHSASSLEDTPQASHGWLRLSSNCNVGSMYGISKPSLLSGECGDVDTDEDSKLPPVRVSRIPSVASTKLRSIGHSEPPKDRIFSSGTTKPSDDAIRRQTSARRRKLQVYLGSRRRPSEQSAEQNRTSQDDSSAGKSFSEPAPVNKPRSIQQTLAEVNSTSDLNERPSSGRAGNGTTTKQCLSRERSVTKALSLFPKQSSFEQARPSSEQAMRTQMSNTSITEPINTSRVARQPTTSRRKTSAPQLAQLEVGPPLSASAFTFDLVAADQPRSSGPALHNNASSFLGAEKLQNEDASRSHRRFDSLRTVLSRSSCKNKLPGISGFRASEGMKVSYSCQLRGQSPSLQQQTLISTTVPMSDLAYKKRKVVEKVKDWWTRRFAQRRWYKHRQRVTHVGGLLV